MAGGAGDDTYVVDNVDDVAVEAVNAGTDTVLASVSYTLASNTENLNLGGTENISGTGNALDNLIVGNSGNNTLIGMEGNDTLDGGAGADVMDGGLGDDTYIVDSTADVVVEAANAGFDTVQSSVSYTLSDNVENLTLIGSIDINATGNALDNILTGNSGANVLDGGAGADTLIGGQGNDTLLGGAGNDRYVFNPGDGADIIIDTLGSDTLYIGGGLIEANLEGVRDGDNMIVSLFGTIETITLTNWFAQNEGVNRIEFSDGSSLDRTGIEGLLNRPPVANPDAITVFEDGGVMNVPTAALLANDTDPNPNDVISVVAVGASAIGASVSLTNGQVQYDIGNRFQELGAGQTVTDSFGYTISDSKGETASSMVNVTITGVNDAPILVAPLADQDITFNKTFSWQMPSGSFIDIDQGDTLDYSATLADGSLLPDWLSFDPITRTFSGMAPKTVGYVDVQVTATDRVAATGSTIDSLAASDIFRISISHGNEGVGDGQDAAPAGTGSNFNDGPGTSPGNPGAGGGINAGNTLLGTEGNDSLTGGSGDDLLDGLGGNDRLEGGAGNDIYLFGRNGGVDTVIEQDATAGNTDVLRFGENIADDQVWFSRVDSDLEVSFIGTDDKAIVNDWYKGTAYHVEQFQTADGKVLLDSQVENLVSAMAAFSPPAAGQTTLPQNYQDALAPVLAANWK